MSNQVNSMNKGLTVKDLVTTGIFTALFICFLYWWAVSFLQRILYLLFSCRQEVGCLLAPFIFC